MSVIAKPQLRNLLITNIKKHLAIAITLSVTGSVAAKYLWAEPRANKVAEFFRTNDNDADTKRLRKLGFYTFKFENDPEELGINVDKFMSTLDLKLKKDD